MFLLALNALTLSTVFGDELCIDLEVGDGDFDWNDDEINEESNDRVCAYQDGGYDDKVCRNGIKRDPKKGDKACFDFGRETLDENKSFYIVTEGSDAVWIDRLIAWRFWAKWRHGIIKDWEKEWGSSNEAGWCLSQDPNDYVSWNSDDIAQYVPDNRCYYALRLEPNGDVYGYYDASVPKICRETKKMNCKQSCPGGWEHVDTTNHGCCSSFTSCGGNMKVCAKDTECRRRTEGGVAALEEGDENWVLLYTPAKDASETANRLVHAESDLSQAEG